MADWPDTDELLQVLDITSDDWDTTQDRIRLAAISKVKHDVGVWDELTDEPDESLAQAALRMAELINERPGTPVKVLGQDPAYRALLFGHRKAFAVA